MTKQSISNMSYAHTLYHCLIKIVSCVQQKNMSWRKRLLLANYDPLTEKDEHEQSSSTCVIDGGGILHRINWVKNETYEEIFQRYASYLENRYGLAKIIFDSYGKASTKDMAHLKRSRTSGREVFFTPSMKLTTTKEEFLSCTENKSRFIKKLARYLTTKGFETTHAEGDADLLIVKTAILSSKTSKTILIGEDTDLLCLLLHYSSETIFPLHFKSEPKKEKLEKCGT
jgi:hypothetical protein